MDLASGTLLWPSLSAPLVHPQPLAADVDCDVVVLGAGVTGTMVALLLASAGVQVAVLDRRGVARGSTPASTALVQYEIDTPLVELEREIGASSARAAYSACRNALDDLVGLTRKFGINCDLRRCGSLFLATDQGDHEWFAREAESRRAIGIEVKCLSARELRDGFDMDRPGALHSSAALELDPYKLTQGLASAAKAHGAHFFAGEAADFELGDTTQQLRTCDGVRLHCRRIVIATGYESPRQFAEISRYCELKSTYALASEPLEGREPWPGDVMIWEAADPYFYARRTVDNRVVIGGEDEPIVCPARRDELIDSKSETLLEKLSKLRPGLRVVPGFCWAGTFACSEDGLPLIGQLRRFPGCHFALGYGGNGITFAVLAAQLIRDAILGKHNPLADVFRFDR